MFKLLFRLFVVLAIFAGIAGGFVFLDYQKFLNTPVKRPADNVFSIQSGDSFNRVVNNLKTRGVIKNDFYLKGLAKMEFDTKKIQAGDYLIEQQTPRTLLRDFIDGKVIDFKLTLPEGKRFADFRQLIADNEHIEHTLEFVPDKDIMAVLNASHPHPEGLFAPDTYHFTKGTKDIDILRRAYDTQQKRMKTAWDNRDKSIPLTSAYELLTLASIIEKETGIASEREEIAGVFVRRLNKNMKLQTDPTVIYGLGDKYKGKLRYSHLKADTPYNTYTRKGLTPTPIALPGMAALTAAAKPKAGKSLYFVANGKGGHTFSETYQQHLKAVKAYRQSQP